MLVVWPRLLANFMYSPVTLRQLVTHPMSAAKFFVARDLVIAETFCRYVCTPTRLVDHRCVR